MNKFELTSAFKPTGDQPEAIQQLTQGVLDGMPAQTLLGVTGSGKTFTIANVIANINKPTLILSHNKTLAAQLYSEFKSFFTNDTFVYCRAKVISRQYKDKNGNERTYTSMKILAMLYLGGVLDKFASHLCFKVNIEDIDEAFCKNIEKMAKKHKGTVPLRATVVDIHDGLTLTMNTRDIRVKVRDIIPLLEQVKGVYDIKPELRP